MKIYERGRGWTAAQRYYNNKISIILEPRRANNWASESALSDTNAQ